MSKSTGEKSKSNGWRGAIIFLVILMNMTLLFRLVWGEQSFMAWQELKQTLAETQAELARQDLIRSELSREIRLLQTDAAYVEKVIRQRLNYVREDEILYLFDDLRPDDNAWTGAEIDERLE